MEDEVCDEDIVNMPKEAVDASIKDFFDISVWNQMTETDKDAQRQGLIMFLLNPENTSPPKFLLEAREKYQKQLLQEQAIKDRQKTIVNNECSNDKENEPPGCSGNPEHPPLQKKKRANTSEPSTSRRDTYKVPKLPLKKYPKRESAATVNYFEEEEPEDDRYIYCDNCNEDVVDYCKKCGMLVYVKDVKVTLGTEDRAKKTTPSIFEVRESPIQGLGVFAVKNIPKGLQLGPYEGFVTKVDSESGQGYSWKLKGGKLVDAADERFSNWMRYVNCARKVTEQNLMAFQYKGELYYRTVKQIPKGVELLVNYGREYCELLGIDFTNYFKDRNEGRDNDQLCKSQGKNVNNTALTQLYNALKKESIINETGPKEDYFRPNVEKTKDYFLCGYCNIGLSSEHYKLTHEKRCRFGKVQVEVGETYECQHCQVVFIRKSNLNEHKCRKKPKRKGNIMNRTILEKFYKCDHCDRKYRRKEELRLHLISKHNIGDGRKFKCNACEYQTYNKSHLAHHIKTQHENSFGLLCVVCRKSFTNKNSLDNHYLTKHRENLSDLRRLITSKIHQCDQCSYQTVLKTNFKNHMLTHEEGADRFKYHCGICGYKSFQKGHLKTHLYGSHTDRQPFVCNLCSRKFNRKQHLDGHILTHHRDNNQLMKSVTSKIHNCFVCSYQTVNTSNYKYHIKTHNKQTKFQKISTFN